MLAKELGDDSHSWAYDGWRLLKWNSSCAEWGAKWADGDVVGCAIDMDNRIMSFYLNGFGEEIGMGVAYDNFEYMSGLYPCLSYNRSETCKFAFNGNEFKHPPPAGYRPYAEHVGECLNHNARIITDFLKPGYNSDHPLDSPSSNLYFEDCFEEQRGETIFCLIRGILTQTNLAAETIN